MELDELKNIWKEEDKNLEGKIKLNEKLLLKMNLDNTTGEFNKLIRQSLLGRNMALVYCLVSISTASLMIEEIEYSLPAALGGLAMLWSFISHLSIEKPNYKDSIVKLQKTICNFRIHMAKNAKYDIGIVALWLLTLAPVCLKYVYGIVLYGNMKALSIYCLISFTAITLMTALSRRMYEEYDQKLKNAEDNLSALIEFETK